MLARKRGEGADIRSRATHRLVLLLLALTAGYGNMLSWGEAYRPKLGERAQTVVLEVDRARMEAGMRALYVGAVATARRAP